MKNTILFSSTYIVALILDLIWLRLIASTIYLTELDGLLRKKGSDVASNIPAALLVYAVIALGVIYFVLPKVGNYKEALIWGAFFGVVTYGMYDLSNYAMLANWPFKFALIDWLWGIIFSSLLTCFALFVHKSL